MMMVSMRGLPPGEVGGCTVSALATGLRGKGTATSKRRVSRVRKKGCLRMMWLAGMTASGCMVRGERPMWCTCINVPQQVCRCRGPVAVAEVGGCGS